MLRRDVPLPRDAEPVVARARAARGIFHQSLVTLFDVVLLPEWRVLLAYELLPASQTIAQMSAGQPLHPRRATALVVAQGDLLADLAGRAGPAGVVGAQRIEALVARARAGNFDSAATFAGLLHRTV